MNRNKFILFKSHIIIFIVVLILSTVCFGSFQNHESLPYKIYIVNRPFRGGLILLSVNVNLQTKTLNLEFNPAGYKELIKVKIAEIIGDYRDLNLLGTFDLECKELEFNQQFQQSQLSIPKVKRGMMLVTWLESEIVNSKETIPPIEKQYLLEAVKIIRLEQNRLGTIGARKGRDELVDEVGRNLEE